MPGNNDSEIPFQFYGRRKGRPLNPGRQEALSRVLPRFEITLPPPGNQLDPASLFGDARPVWLEIGFGNGEHLAALAARYPDIGFIGAEPYINGVAALAKRIDREGLCNIRLLPDDARPLLEALRPACIARCYVLFPDPWPKKRHWYRRFIAPENLDRLARILGDTAPLITATDDPGLADWMLWYQLAHPAFVWTAERAADWRNPPPEWTATRYEQKTRQQGREPVFFTFERVPRQ